MRVGEKKELLTIIELLGLFIPTTNIHSTFPLSVS